MKGLIIDLVSILCPLERSENWGGRNRIKVESQKIPPKENTKKHLLYNAIIFCWKNSYSYVDEYLPDLTH